MYRYTSAVRNSDSNSICETLFHIFGMQDSVRKNANEVHDDKCCRKEGNFFRTLVNLFGKAILRKSLFVVWELCRRSLGRLSVFSRCSLGGIWQGIRDEKGTAILTNALFVVWSSFFLLCAALFLRVGTLRAQHSKCHPRHFFILGSSLVFNTENTLREQKTEILRIVLFLIQRINIPPYPLSLPIS